MKALLSAILALAVGSVLIGAASARLGWFAGQLANGAEVQAIDRPRLVRAFASVESSTRNLPPYRDGPSLSFGYFGFKRPRWQECGGKPSDWGKAGRAEQYRVMALAVDRYLRTLPAGVDPIAWAGTKHNGGRWRGETTYTRKLRAAYLKIP
jgi:hypothetical protein